MILLQTKKRKGLGMERLKNARSSGVDYLLLRYMADNADEQGILKSRMIDIAEGARISYTTTIRIINRLEQLGDIEIRHKAGLNHSNIYRVGWYDERATV